jgi:hypothetical protein
VFENRLPRRRRQALHARYEQNAWRYGPNWPVTRAE